MHTTETAASSCHAGKPGPDDTAKTVHIALICPFSSGPGRGNITTVDRIAGNLPAAGCRLTQISLDAADSESGLAALERDRPDLLHAFHAHYAGPATRNFSESLHIPYLITITGSDLFDDSLRNAPETRQAICDASALTCFDALVAQRLAESFPDIAGRIEVIPQGVAPLALHEPYPRSPEDFLILLPAALRPVKGVVEAIAALTPLAREFPALCLLVAGGTIDPAYAEVVKHLAAGQPWVRLLGDVPRQNMGALYAAADLVLNSSLFEGGMANSLLEAMSMGVPVLARNIVGNRSLIRHGETGWLYNNDEELRQLTRHLLLETNRSATVAKSGQLFVRLNCSPLTEANRYAELYRRLKR